MPCSGTLIVQSNGWSSTETGTATCSSSISGRPIVGSPTRGGRTRTMR
jgi:hypothetical protein